MMLQVTIVCLLLLVGQNHGLGNEVYISQSAAGAGDGTDCDNAYSYEFFNTAGNWGSPAGRIRPGTTVHLCGTIRSELRAQGSGSSQAPIRIVFEPNAKISLPVCSLSRPCLSLGGGSHVMVDGGRDGVIENTGNGSALANRSPSVGLEVSGCRSCEVKNLTIRNIYQHTDPSDHLLTDYLVPCVQWGGNSVNVSIHDNILHDCGVAISMNWGTAARELNYRIYSNDVYRVSHGVAGGVGVAGISGMFIYNNHFHDLCNWNTVTNTYHENGIFFWAAERTGANLGELHIFSNTFDGCGPTSPNGRNNFSNWIQLWSSIQQGGGETYLYNNVFVGVNAVSVAGADLLNNTFLGNYPSGSGFYSFSNSGSDLRIVNNYVSGTQYLAAFGAGSRFVEIDHNAYANCSNPYWCFNLSGLFHSATFSKWQAYLEGAGVAGAEAHSVAASPFASSLGGVDAITGRSAAGAIVAGAGKNLSALGLPELNKDRNGHPRPLTGMWDIGAFNASSACSASRH